MAIPLRVDQWLPVSRLKGDLPGRGDSQKQFQYLLSSWKKVGPQDSRRRSNRSAASFPDRGLGCIPWLYCDRVQDGTTIATAAGLLSYRARMLVNRDTSTDCSTWRRSGGHDGAGCFGPVAML